MFFFYVPRSFRTWAVMALQSVLPLVTVTRFSHFAKAPDTRAVIHLQMLAGKFTRYFPSVFLVLNMHRKGLVFQALHPHYVYKTFQLSLPHSKH